MARAASSPQRFVAFDDHVHLVSSIGGGEHTLCGIAMDAADTENDETLRWQPTNARVVDCPACGAEILGCRGVRVDFAAGA